MKKRVIALLIAVVIVFCALAGCNGKTNDNDDDKNVDTTPVTLTVAGSWSDCKALETIGRAFTEKYPNCTVVYESLQDYYASVGKRLTGDNQIDLFFTTDITAESELYENTLDILSRDDIDLSNAFSGLIDNFTHKNADGVNSLHTIPLGAEMRGMYVNKTLLDSLGLAVPTNQKTLLEACATLKEKGYTPLQGNPGMFSQHLLYPWICNTIVNTGDGKTNYNMVENREKGVSKLFKEPFELMYTLVEKDYYDYKTIETEKNAFTDSSDEAYARYFLNIAGSDDSFSKTDDIGQVAFMPAPMSLNSIIQKTKEDYHSKIEYVFIPAPVSNEGGFVYLSPAHGISANKNSPNLDWSAKFLNFLFEPENNETFAKEFNAVPNTKEAFSYISNLFDVPSTRISEVGQVTFSYSFYKIIVANLMDVSKANNPKYMKEDPAGKEKNSDGVSVSLYPLDYYMNNLETALTTPEGETTE